MVKESASGNVSGFLSEVPPSLSSINLALAFMVALAWNEVAKDAENTKPEQLYGS